jgi:SAM-dependent methyltransferase
MLSDTHLIVGDIQDRNFLGKLPSDLVGKCDKIFSSATLHWCSRDPLAVLVNVHHLLKGGGLFVAEMGGRGNIAGMTPSVDLSEAMAAEHTFYGLGVRDALHTALRKRGIDPVARDPWFYPTPDQYIGLLRSASLVPLRVSLHPRTTPFADLAGWIRLFGGKFLEGIKSENEPELVNEVVASCRESGACHWDEEKKLWYLDYVRLRIIAVKVQDHDHRK